MPAADRLTTDSLASDRSPTDPVIHHAAVFSAIVNTAARIDSTSGQRRLGSAIRVPGLWTGLLTRPRRWTADLPKQRGDLRSARWAGQRPAHNRVPSRKRPMGLLYRPARPRRVRLPFFTETAMVSATKESTHAFSLGRGGPGAAGRRLCVNPPGAGEAAGRRRRLPVSARRLRPGSRVVPGGAGTGARGRQPALQHRTVLRAPGRPQPG